MTTSRRRHRWSKGGGRPTSANWRSRREELSRKYESQKTFGQIINPLLGAGLRLEKIEEHAEDYWDQFANLPKEVVAKLPNTFSLLMRKD